MHEVYNNDGTSCPLPLSHRSKQSFYLGRNTDRKMPDQWQKSRDPSAGVSTQEETLF
jgi:hypothetical protein